MPSEMNRRWHLVVAVVLLPAALLQTYTDNTLITLERFVPIAHRPSADATDQEPEVEVEDGALPEDDSKREEGLPTGRAPSAGDVALRPASPDQLERTWRTSTPCRFAIVQLHRRPLAACDRAGTPSHLERLRTEAGCRTTSLAVVAPPIRSHAPPRAA